MSVQPVHTAAAAAPEGRKAPPPAAGASFAGALAEASTAKKPSARTKLVEHPNGDYKAPRNERTAPVEGHAYVDVLNGPRNGMFVNTSGNKRHGQAFVLVERDGKRFHIYGSGEDRLVVCLKPKPKADPAPGALAAPATGR
jgi:hypothetical protein